MASDSQPRPSPSQVCSGSNKRHISSPLLSHNIIPPVSSPHCLNSNTVRENAHITHPTSEASARSRNARGKDQIWASAGHEGKTVKPIESSAFLVRTNFGHVEQNAWRRFYLRMVILASDSSLTKISKTYMLSFLLTNETRSFFSFFFKTALRHIPCSPASICVSLGTHTHTHKNTRTQRHKGSHIIYHAWIFYLKSCNLAYISIGWGNIWADTQERAAASSALWEDSINNLPCASCKSLDKKRNINH